MFLKPVLSACFPTLQSFLQLQKNTVKGDALYVNIFTYKCGCMDHLSTVTVANALFLSFFGI